VLVAAAKHGPRGDVVWRGNVASLLVACWCHAVLSVSVACLAS
jgi:hypothetical protein